jgi:flagellar hook-associated protein 2
VRATLVAGRPDGGDQRLVLTAQKPAPPARSPSPTTPDTPADLTGPVPWSGPRPTRRRRRSPRRSASPCPRSRRRTRSSPWDGIASRAPSNVVADAIPGVTLTLGALGSSQLTVERQPGAAADAVKAFVEAYNEVQKSAAAQMLPNADGSRPPLKGEPLLRAVRTGLASAITGTASLTTSAGAPNGVQPDFATFSAFGVSVQKDGSLSFDATRFDAAYQGANRRPAGRARRARAGGRRRRGARRQPGLGRHRRAQPLARHGECAPLRSHRRRRLAARQEASEPAHAVCTLRSRARAHAGGG